MLTRFITWLAHATSPTNRFRWFNTLFILVFFSLPIIVLSAISYTKIYGELTNRAFARRQAIVRPVSIALEERLDRIVNIGSSFAVHPQIREAIFNKKWVEANQILDIFKSVLNEPFVDRIFLADAEGTIRAADTPSLPDAVGKNPVLRDWYKGIVSTGKPYVSEIYRRSEEPQYNVVAVATPIKDEKGALAGAIILQIRLDHFLDWLKEIPIGEEGFIYVVDQRGKVVAHPKVNSQKDMVDFSNIPAIQKIKLGEYGVEIQQYGTSDKREVVVAYEPTSRYKWGVILEQPSENAFALRYNTLRIILLVYTLIFLFNLLLVCLILRIFVHYQDHHN